jgi:hypothetical protein
MTGSGPWPSHLQGIFRIITQNGARNVKDGLTTASRVDLATL